MAGTSITKSEFDVFKNLVTNEFAELNKKVDKIIDPQNGIFRSVDHIDQTAKRAHERIDEKGEEIKQLSICIHGNPADGRQGMKTKINEFDEFMKTSKKIIWKIITPILALLGIGTILIIAFLVPRISQAIELFNKMKP